MRPMVIVSTHMALAAGCIYPEGLAVVVVIGRS
jgi:hypothetical protein